METVAVLAGGLGTRIQSVTQGLIPKAMVEVAGHPFIDLKLAGLASQGAKQVFLLLGVGSEHLIDHVQNGAQYGLEVQMIPDPPELAGTGGAVAAALPALGERFWVTYADTYLRFDVRKAEAAFDIEQWLGMMVVLQNRDRWDMSNTEVTQGRVTEYRKGRPTGTYEFIDYGMTFFTREAFTDWRGKAPFDLEPLLQGLISSGKLGAFEANDRFYEIGTPEGLHETQSFFEDGEEIGRLNRFLPRS